MTITEIKACLAEIEKLNADKGFPPLTSCEMVIKTNKFHCYISENYGKKNWPNGNYMVFNGDTPAECLALAYHFIDALPDPDTAAKRAAVAQYGKAVDALHDAGFDDVVMIPVRETMAALTSNLLTYEGVHPLS